MVDCQMIEFVRCVGKAMSSSMTAFVAVWIIACSVQRKRRKEKKVVEEGERKGRQRPRRRLQHRVKQGQCYRFWKKMIKRAAE